MDRDKDQGVSILSPDRKQFTHLKGKQGNGSLNSNNVRSFYEDEKNNIWIGTDGGGINVYDPRKKIVTNVHYVQADMAGISSNVTFALYENRDGIVWIGGYLAGLNIYDKSNDMFQSFSRISMNELGLSNSNVNAVCDDSQGIFWMGTDYGLNKYDPATNRFTYFLNSPHSGKSISGNRIKAIYQDSYKNLWIGTAGSGLNLLANNDHFIRFKHTSTNTSGLTHNDVGDLLEDSKKNFWVATSGGGLNLLDRATMKFKHFWLKNSLNKLCPVILSIIEDKKQGGLWIGTNNGLCYFNSEKKQLKMYRHDKNNPNSLSSDEAVVVYQDSRQKVWIGTGTGKGGLDLYNTESDNFKSIKIENDFKNNTITGVVEDNNSFLWVSTFRGVSRFNTNTNTWNNYTQEDGLKNREFIKGSYFKRNNGHIIFGGTNGITVIHPEEFKKTSYSSNVVINKLLILNKEVLPGEKNGILSKVIAETDEITLGHTQYVVTFEFAALSFSSPERTEYAYKLEAFENNWNYIDTRRSATYTNLSPGKYTFRVKASNGDGDWSNKEVALCLIVTPPYWLTWWFKSIVLFVIAGAFLVFIKMRERSIKLHRQALEQQVKERTEQLAYSIEEERKARREAETAYQEAEHATRAKSIFLATMSHEIRTPMNGVIGMSAMLASTALTDEQKMYTETITSCGESLLNVINDILDFSKIESGKLELENETFNLRTCIEDILDIFGSKAAEIGLDIVYQIDNDVPLQIVGDDLRLRQILTNLVGNSLKFTLEGEVFVGVHLSKPVLNGQLELEFEVRDTGIGIPAEKLERLFKAFSQIDSSTTRKYGGTGLGLAISEKLVLLMGGKIWVHSNEGQGSSFYFSMITQTGTKETKQYLQFDMMGQKGKRVLLVDDNSSHLSVLKNIMEEWQMNTVMANSGKAALDILSKNTQFDLVLIDRQMPGIDGIELARTIKNQNPLLSLMLMSPVGYDLNFIDTQLFNSTITKPVKYAALSKQVLINLQGSHKALPEQKTTQHSISPDFSRDYPLNIMVAEDNLINQKVILHILGKMGFEPDLVENGQDAVNAAAEKQYDVIFMDMQMPEMDGLEATRIIRQSLKKQPVIIALTANTIQGDKESCLSAGMNDFISKPIKLEELIFQLKSWSLKIAEQKVLVP
ncbi:MAG: response regulator [Chitinophagaceae bacterium]